MRTCKSVRTFIWLKHSDTCKFGLASLQLFHPGIKLRGHAPWLAALRPIGTPKVCFSSTMDLWTVTTSRRACSLQIVSSCALRESRSLASSVACIRAFRTSAGALYRYSAVQGDNGTVQFFSDSLRDVSRVLTRSIRVARSGQLLNERFDYHFLFVDILRLILNLGRRNFSIERGSTGYTDRSDRRRESPSANPWKLRAT